MRRQSSIKTVRRLWQKSVSVEVTKAERRRGEVRPPCCVIRVHQDGGAPTTSGGRLLYSAPCADRRGVHAISARQRPPRELLPGPRWITVGVRSSVSADIARKQLCPVSDEQSNDTEPIPILGVCRRVIELPLA